VDSCSVWRDSRDFRPRRRPPSAQTGPSAAGDYPFLPRYARAQNYRSLKQSSFDRTGGNADSWPIEPGATREVFASEGPGVITHIWFTIAAQSSNHLKEIVIRIYWDGQAKPSVEVPVGDFFGLESGAVLRLSVGVPELFLGEGVELLLRHALPQVGAHHRHQRKRARRGGVLFQHRLPDRARAAGRSALLPRAIPPGRRRTSPPPTIGGPMATPTS
jgi:hypothetical protein